MDANFWHRKWKNNEIGFHTTEANPLLIKYFKDLRVKERGRVFVPLCGKTLDMHWLLAHGYRVVGAELSRLAIEQFFSGLGVEPEISQAGKLIRFSAENVELFVGDIFDLTSQILGEVDAIYDRAALVALPESMRDRYTRHLLALTNSAPQLLITFEYDQSLVEGPPFSISGEVVKQHYGSSYDLSLADSVDLPDGLKGKYPAKESVWLLRKS